MFWKRIAVTGKPRPDEAAVAAAAEAAQQSASQRLGRLVSRQRDEQADGGKPAEQTASQIAAHFGDCAFLVLGVPLTADAAAIHRAVDDLSFAEDVDPQVLSRAQAELLSPRERLRHELAWLPDCDPAFQSRAAAAIKAGDVNQIEDLRFGAAGLARANLACALLAARPRDEALLVGLLTDLPRWQPGAILGAIETARAAAGIRVAEDSHFETALADRLAILAAHVAEAAAATREGRLALGRAITTHADAVRAASNPAVEAIIAAYGRTVDPRLQAMQARIAEACAAIAANPHQPAVLTSIMTTLDLWSQLRLPLQKLEEARGLDDPASAQLFGELRDLGISIANNHQMYGETLRLMRALKVAFAAVPGVQPMLQRDLPTLIGNVLVDHMGALTVDTVRNLGSFCSELRSQGFGAGSSGPRTARLIDCFEQFHEAQPDCDVPFVYVRQLAIAVNDKAAAPALALQIVEWLLAQRVPEQIHPQLVQDMCRLQQNINKQR